VTRWRSAAGTSRRSCGEGHERRGGEGHLTARRRSTWRRRSSGGDRAARSAKPRRGATDPGEEQGPEGGATQRGARRATVVQRCGANDTRAAAVDETVRLHRGETPWRANPGRGSGVKQTREAGGGASRRGREKRRGRNGAGPGNPARGRHRLTSRRGKKPHGRHLRSTAGAEGARSGSDSAGERKLTRG
jgi:hypothetical protein